MTLVSRTKMLDEAKNGRKGHGWFIEILIFIALFFVTEEIMSIPTVVATVFAAMNSPEFQAASQAAYSGESVDYMELISRLMGTLPWWYTLFSLFVAGLQIVTGIFFCTKIQKRTVASMGFRKGNALKEYLMGALIGTVAIAATVGIGVLIGAFSISKASFSPIFFVYTLAYILQGAGEEVMCRGCLLTSISRKNPVWLAVLLNSVMFAVLHLLNPGISVLAFVNLVLFGVFFSLYFLKRGNIWGVCAMHTCWNLFQGNFFGISVSGTGAGLGTVFSTVEKAGVNSLLSGGAFGIEGGICTTIITALGILFCLFVLPSKKNELVAEEAV